MGCSVGRNLRNLDPGSVGVNHNADAIAVCRARGLATYTTDEAAGTDLLAPGSFDSMLLAHVLEHVDQDIGDQILLDYLPAVRPGGKVAVITPQEVGFRSDSTHVRFVEFDKVRAHVERLGLVVHKTYSFPFPRPVGRVFAYNEFVTVAHLPR